MPSPAPKSLALEICLLGVRALRSAFFRLLSGVMLVSVLALSGRALPFVTQPAQLDDPAFADWIGSSAGGFNDAGLYLFRKQLALESKPAHFIVHVSADNRYRLFVNGTPISWGPANSDLAHWNYETVDLAPFLRAGANQLAAQVWRSVPGASPARQISRRLGFILQGDGPAECSANTGASWRVIADPSYAPIPHRSVDVGGGYIAGPTDRVDARLRPWGWQEANFDDSAWLAAVPLGKGNHAGLNTYRGTPWLLEARSIPAMEERVEPMGDLVQVQGVAGLATDAPFGPAVRIPANTQAEFLIDRRILTMGFPRLVVSGGKNARVRLQYQESLFQADGTKGNRSVWQGKVMKGYYDEFVADGAAGREFVPLWLRVFRYVKITVNTAEEPLVLDSLENRFVAYPLVEKARFSSSDATLAPVWQTSWRTARLCALETYMDCPYYEQLQYIGDTRIQALISLYVSGDDRLARRALESFNASLQPMGLTKSSHPSRDTQIIPPFSLIYILSLHDFYMLSEDTSFLAGTLPGTRFILDWFLQRIDPATGLLGPLPYWNHVDGGVAEFAAGSPPGAEEGGSAHVSLLLALALERAADLSALAPRPGEREFYLAQARALKEAVRRQCWDESRQLFAETSAKTLFTTHTNSLAVLADAAPSGRAALARRLVEDRSLVQPTLYFDYYVFEALASAGLGDLVLPRLERWKAFIAAGLTTFPEHGVESRSDCHAWSAHPLYALLATTCGIRPASPRFGSLVISPAPGTLTEFSGEMPHPRGTVRVSFTRQPDALKYTITLPEGLPAVFRAHGQEIALKAGENQVSIPAR